ncbi:MAG: ATP-binding protein [Clostridiales Family XIII bacterium]|nr:ATP-binding protein [Clostridiales Family XIII bacterium]
MKNPFTPVFGHEPLILAGREKLIADVLRGLDSPPGEPNRITIFTGPRGSGKTVLLGHIASEAEARGWISVHTSAAEGMLTDIAEQIERKAAEHLPKKSKSKLTGVQVSGFGFTREVEPEKSGSWRTQMDGLLDLLAERKIGLLFSIDEVTADVPEMIRFVSTFQIFVMEKRNVALMMAGLPSRVLGLITHKDISFLRRAFRRDIGSVSIPEARAAMKKTIDFSGRGVEGKALDFASEKTEGLPFLIQLIGYHMFNQSERKRILLEDAQQGVKDAEKDMEDMILDATLAELTDAETRFLYAMLGGADRVRVGDVAKNMEVSASQASHIKRKLVRLGIVAECGRGVIEFAMPMLKKLLEKEHAF